MNTCPRETEQCGLEAVAQRLNALIAEVARQGIPANIPADAPAEVKLDGLVAAFREMADQCQAAHEAQQQAEAALHAILDNTPTAVYVKDLQGRHTIINHMCETMLGIPVGQAIGKTSHELFAAIPGLADRMCASDQQVLRENAPCQTEQTIAFPDGAHTYLSAKFPVRNDEGQVIAVGGISLDITERKRAEAERERLLAEVKQQATELDAIIDNMANGVMIYGPQGEILRMNVMAQRYLGYTLNETSRPIWQRSGTSRMLTPEGNPLALEGLPIMYALRGETITGFHAILVRDDEDDAHLSITATPIYGPDGRITGAILTASDITLLHELQQQRAHLQLEVQRQQAELALRESDARFHRLFDAMRSSIVIFDASEDGQSFRVKDANPIAQSIYQFEKHNAIGQRLEDFLPAAAVNNLKEKLHAAWLTGRPQLLPPRPVRVDDAQHWMEGCALKLTTGEVVTITEDITARKEMHDALRQSREQFRALTLRQQTIREEEQTLLARHIHDVLGHALAAHKMDLAWIGRQITKHCGDAELAPVLERIGDLSRAVDETITNIRQLSADLRPPMLDTLGLVDAIEWATQQFSARTEIPCLFSCNVAGVYLPAETATALYRIGQELLTNIANYAQASTARVVLTVEEQALSLVIIDDGRGIPEEAISAPTSLGLIGIRERVALLNGAFDIMGAPGGGTVAIIYVPVKEDEKYGITPENSVAREGVKWYR